MKPFKVCSCRDAETGKLLGKKCPDLDRRRHGKWYARYEAPRTADGTRRQPRIGPYDTSAECKQALAEVLGEAGKSNHVEDRKMTLGAYLEKRHGWRVSEAETGEGLKRSTLNTDREIIDLYLKPGLGHLKLVELRDHHIRDLYAAMRQINREDEPQRPSEMLRRLLEARAAKPDGRYSNRPVSESRIKRVHAVLTGTLNVAVKVSKILSASPADGVLRTKGGGRKNRAKPLLWTDERVEHWQRTGKVPAKVMVWAATHCGAFLDFAEHDRLYPLWHFDAYWGLRRGELAGLDKQDISVGRRRCHVRQAQHDDELDDVKSEDSDRIVVFDEETARVLKVWQQRQEEERIAWEEAYTDSGRFFTYEDGRALRPAYISQRFDLLVERYNTIRRRHFEDGWPVERIARRHRTAIEVVRIALEGPPLPPIRFHDLRHGSATMLHAAGVSMKVVSEILGHASESFTADVYAVVAEELAEDAAAKISAFVPRRSRT